MGASRHHSGESKPQDHLILVVDDDEDMLEFVKITLRREGFRVETAPDGPQAFEKVSRLAPSAVVTDLMFPWHGGQELIQALQMGDLAEIPVVVMTGVFKNDAAKALVCGQPNVIGYLEKPFDATALLSILERELGMTRS